MSPDTIAALRTLLPTLNACLNATSAVLLIAGYLAIRRRTAITLHKVCMVSALAVSALFLASYLFYHFGVIRGEHVSFHERVPEAPSWVANLYLVILLSHISLAVPSVLLALGTAYLGLRDRFKSHVRLARWTLPIWLYVSVTGVVVYWMLYRLYS